MTIKPNPLFAEIATTKNLLDRLFGRDDFLDMEGITTAGEWAPTIDIIEDDHTVTIKAELPGIEAKDIAVAVDNNVLTLKGERRVEEEVKKESYHRMERAYGTFNRSFVLPMYVDVANVKADFKNGLLMLTLPKKDEARPRPIEVKVA